MGVCLALHTQPGRRERIGTEVEATEICRGAGDRCASKLVAVGKARGAADPAIRMCACCARVRQDTNGGSVRGDARIYRHKKR